MARCALLAVACLSSALGFIAPRPHTAACKQRLATPPRGTVVASLGASDVLVALGEESGLPDPTGAVVAFAFLFAAFAYTQFDMVGVTDQEELEGAEGARRARDALARKRGYSESRPNRLGLRFVPIAFLSFGVKARVATH